MEEPETIVINNPYVTCYYCRGHGLVDGFDGPVDCPECRGNTVIRDRDRKGRFVTHPFIWKHLGSGEYGYVGPAPTKEEL